MKVWIDQDLCTGDGLCEEICPEMFVLLDDGLAYVKNDGVAMSDPAGPEGLAEVPSNFADAVKEAAEECPGECIFVVQS
jgi:ferredoxin